MIVSVSRRTDVPAFYGEWFMNRVRAGFCAVQNPFNAKQVSFLSLEPLNVDAFVFWTKDPAPFVDYLDELDALGYRYYFQFTLNDYPTELEPRVPDAAERVRTFIALSERLGKRRVSWRYDPIILSNRTDADYHRTTFERLARRLAPHTGRVTISVVEWYRKTERNLRPLEQLGYSFVPDARELPETDDLLADMATVAAELGIEMFACAQERDYSDLGIRKGACIDGELLTDLWGILRSWKNDSGQRLHCGCTVSRDIGANDTCLHGCPYCYATRNTALALRRHAAHDPTHTGMLSDPSVTTQSKI